MHDPQCRLYYKEVMDKAGQVPGLRARWLTRDVDNPDAGWKGRGLWSTNGDRTPWLKEGGKGSMPRAVHIQFRPDPLAN